LVWIHVEQPIEIAEPRRTIQKVAYSLPAAKQIRVGFGYRPVLSCQRRVRPHANAAEWAAAVAARDARAATIKPRNGTKKGLAGMRALSFAMTEHQLAP